MTPAQQAQVDIAKQTNAWLQKNAACESGHACRVTRGSAGAARGERTAASEIEGAAMIKQAALTLPGEMTEGQYLVAQQFARLMHVMRDRLSAGMAAMEAVGLPLDVQACDRAYWLLADLETPVHAAMLEHIGACVTKQTRRVA